MSDRCTVSIVTQAGLLLEVSRRTAVTRASGKGRRREVGYLATKLRREETPALYGMQRGGMPLRRRSKRAGSNRYALIACPPRGQLEALDARPSEVRWMGLDHFGRAWGTAAGG